MIETDRIQRAVERAYFKTILRQSLQERLKDCINNEDETAEVDPE